MNNENRPHFKQGAVKYTKGYSRRLFFSKFISFIIVLIGLSLIALTIYVYVKQPVRTEGQEFVKASTVYQRMPEIGEKIVVVETDRYNMFTPLERALFEQEIYEAEIVAGPYGKIEKSEDRYLVIFADQTISISIESLDNLEDEYLDKEYVVRKIDKQGDFIEEEFDRVISNREILGLIENGVD